MVIESKTLINSLAGLHAYLSFVAIYHIKNSEYTTNTEKFLQVLVSLLLPIIGSIFLILFHLSQKESSYSQSKIISWLTFAPFAYGDSLGESSSCGDVGGFDCGDSGGGGD